METTWEEESEERARKRRKEAGDVREERVWPSLGLQRLAEESGRFRGPPEASGWAQKRGLDMPIVSDAFNVTTKAQREHLIKVWPSAPRA